MSSRSEGKSTGNRGTETEGTLTCKRWGGEEKKTFSREGPHLEEEPLEGKMPNTQEFWDNMYTKQRRIAEAAQKHAGESLVSVAHHMDAEWMYCAYEWTRRDGAAGVDGVTAEEYERGLWEKLQNLVELLKSGKYRAPPVKRVHIPKAGSKTEKRPIGIPTYEDKAD